MNPTILLAIAAGALATLPIHIVIAYWNRARWNAIYAEMTAVTLSKVEEAFRRGHSAAWPAMQELLDVSKERDEALNQAQTLWMALESLLDCTAEVSLVPGKNDYTVTVPWELYRVARGVHKGFSDWRKKVSPRSLSVDDKKPVEL